MTKVQERLTAIFNGVCQHYGITIEQLQGLESVKRAHPSWQNRKKGNKVKSSSKVAIAKQAAAYLVKCELEVSHRTLMVMLGYKRPQSITDNVKKALNVLKVDKGFKEDIRLIKTIIGEA